MEQPVQYNTEWDKKETLVVPNAEKKKIKAFITKEVCKGGFFSESAIRVSNLQISKKYIPKNYPELEI